MKSVFDIIPGSTISDERHDPKASVGRIEFQVGDVALQADLVLPITAPDWAVPLCGSVYRDGKQIWNFQKENFVGRAHLVFVENEYSIAFVGQGSNSIERVKVLADVVAQQSTGLRRSVVFKIAAANELGFDYSLSQNEQIVKAKLDSERIKLAEEAAAKAKAERQAEKEAREALRTARRQAIAGRPDYKVRAKTGSKPLFGQPVEDDEWQCLPDGTWCVAVEGYDPETGHCAALIDHFVVSKKGGKVQKAAVTGEITFVERQQIDPPEVVGTVMVEFEDDVHELPVYRPQDVELLKKLQIPGLWATQLKGKYVFGRIIFTGNDVKTTKIDAKLFELAA